jgi:P4 family phage/plasmid primase-like protien
MAENKDVSLIRESDPELAAEFDRAAKKYKLNPPESVIQAKKHLATKGVKFPDVAQAYLKINSYVENVKRFYEVQPFFYDKQKIFWFWNHDLCCYEQIDDIDVMNALDDTLGFDGQTVGTQTKTQYIEAFKRVGRKNHPKPAPKKWVQFKDKAYSLTAKVVHDVTPDYFFTNPIPWELGEDMATPVMDKLFEEWVGMEYIQTLYEIIAYCCYSDYPMHQIFCLVGSGRNGKSKFQGLITKFIGQSNMTSTELDLLIDNRFESFKLFKKLVCILGETNYTKVKKTSLLKKLCGQDLIGFEKKNKDPFDDYNYAKIIINSNSLPSSGDTSEGFYRRWIIIDFPNKFPEGKDILATIPEQEYSNLARKVCTILPALLKGGKFTHQGSIEERRERYIMASNPLPLYMEQFCEKADDYFILYGELYTEYIKFLKGKNRRKVSKPEFKEALEEEGFWVEKTSKNIAEENFEPIWKNANWISGVRLK